MDIDTRSLIDPFQLRHKIVFDRQASISAKVINVIVRRNYFKLLMSAIVN